MKGLSPLWRLRGYSITDNNWDPMHTLANIVEHKHEVAMGQRLTKNNTEQDWCKYEQLNNRAWQPGSAPFVLPAAMRELASRRLQLLRDQGCPVAWRDGGSWHLAWAFTDKGQTYSLKAHDWHLLVSPIGIWAITGCFTDDSQLEAFVLMLDAIN